MYRTYLKSSLLGTYTYFFILQLFYDLRDYKVMIVLKHQFLSVIGWFKSIKNKNSIWCILVATTYKLYYTIYNIGILYILNKWQMSK